jgi:antitoxin HicB
VAKVVELPGCSAHGADEQEALRNLEEAQRLWIEDCLAAGDAVPEPAREDPLPSGKWVQRVPRSLHRRLSQMAKEEGVSLNQLVTSMLSQQLSGRAMQKALEPMVVSSGSSLRHPRAAH